MNKYDSKVILVQTSLFPVHANYFDIKTIKSYLA